MNHPASLLWRGSEGKIWMRSYMSVYHPSFVPFSLSAQHVSCGIPSPLAPGPGGHPLATHQVSLRVRCPRPGAFGWPSQPCSGPGFGVGGLQSPKYRSPLGQPSLVGTAGLEPAISRPQSERAAIAPCPGILSSFALDGGPDSPPGLPATRVMQSPANPAYSAPTTACTPPPSSSRPPSRSPLGRAKEGRDGVKSPPPYLECKASQFHRG